MDSITERITIHMDRTTIDLLKGLKIKTGLNMSKLIRQIIQEYLEIKSKTIKELAND